MSTTATANYGRCTDCYIDVATQDDARAEANRRYNSATFHSDLTYPAHALESHRRGAFVAGAEWAAGRAETTTEDVWDHGYRAGLRDASRGAPGESPNPYRAETTTATTEDAARAIHDRHCTSDDHGPHCMFWDEDYESAEALHARGLLATARTRPTRDDLARAIASGYEPDHPAPNRHDYRAADAVLALLRDGAR